MLLGLFAAALPFKDGISQANYNHIRYVMKFVVTKHARNVPDQRVSNFFSVQKALK
jgi:hypothetical protein